MRELVHCIGGALVWAAFVYFLHPEATDGESIIIMMLGGVLGVLLMRKEP